MSREAGFVPCDHGAESANIACLSNRRIHSFSTSIPATDIRGKPVLFFQTSQSEPGDYQRPHVKICVWGINYDPEPTGIGPFNTDLCVYLAERGHDVTMISAFPYYPWWKKPESAKGKLFEKSVVKGVKLHRCWHYVPGKPSTLTRLIHEMSFVTTSTLRALFLPAADAYLMISPPLFLGLGLFIVSRLKRRPFLVHVQDLQPDAALGLGMIKPGLAVRALYALEKWNYTLAVRVSGISQGMLQAFAKKRVPAEKIVMYPNWIPDGVPPAPTGTASFRAANGISTNTPLIAYSGNVGVKQGLEAVVHAAALAKERKGKTADGLPEAGPRGMIRNR